LLQLASSALPTLNWDESLLRLALAALLGGLIGFEREMREREAGLRTHLLVSLGSALFTIVGAYGFHAFLDSGANVVRADPTRIAAQIVTGIGFLGAGAIIRQGLSVRGLTTAATLWVVALPAGQPPGEVIDEVEKTGARIASLEVSQEGDRRRLALDVVLPRDIPPARIVARIADLEDVVEVRWTD